MKSGKVAIILLNWNSLEDTLECLSSLSQLEYPEYVVIVVDNNSSEDPAPILDRYPDTELLRNDVNSGFAGGNNLGFHRASELGCEYCWVLNNDTVVEPDALKKLVSALEKNQDLVAVTNLVKFYYQPEQSWFAGGVFKHGLPSIKGYFEKIELEDAGKAEVTDTEYLCGCSFLARLNALEAVGGFDEGYFCYVEDVDLSLMLKAKGGGLGYVPNAVVLHKVSRASGQRSPLKLYYKHRNMLYFLRKHNMPVATRTYWWKVSLRTIASLVLRRGEPRAAWYLGLGLMDAQLNRMGKTKRI